VKTYKTFYFSTELDSSFDMLISIGGDGTIPRAATLVRDSIPLRYNPGRLGFSFGTKENIAAFCNL
jgi:NAD+ kinase